MYMVSKVPFARQEQAYVRALDFPPGSSSWTHIASFSLSWVIEISFVCVCIIDAVYLIKEKMSSESLF